MITFRNLGKLGRFGNQLFQYAGTRLYAELNGFSWSFPAWDGVKLFKGVWPWTFREHLYALSFPTMQLADMTSTNWPERILTPLEKWYRTSIPVLYNQPIDNISLFGYMQDKVSLDWLRARQGLVREWFIFKDNIESTFRHATDKYRPWLAAHIRHGDMVKRHMATNLDDVAAHIERLQGTRSLFIASDNTSARKSFSGSIAPMNPLPELPAYVFDFWMMKESEVLVGSGSTFAWWAAFLGQPDYWSPPLNRTWKSGESTPPISHLRIP